MKNKPDKNRLLQLATLLYTHLGQVDKLVEITGESMAPTFRSGSLAVLSAMPNPELLNWSEYYYIIDTNGQGRVRRVYASEIQNCIKLVADHPDQDKYPPVAMNWNQIKAIFKVRAEIVKH